MVLSEEYPRLAAEWSANNGKKILDEYTRGSHYRALWKCTVNDEHPEWQVSIKDRVRYGTGCPYCSNKKVYKGNSFGYLFPNIAKEWSKDNKKTIYEYTPGSKFKGSWICSNCFGEWETQICSRCELNSGCPYCYGNRLHRGNSVGIRFPHLLKEWSEKNEGKTLYDYGSSSREKAWWKCLAEKNHPDWETPIQCRIEGSRCLYCVGQLVCKENCLATRFPHLVEEWSERNEGTPYDFVPNSAKRKLWRCLKNNDHPEWETTISARTRKDSSGCPYCTNTKVCRVNSLGYNYPELIREWGDNNDKTPFDYVYGSCKIKVWWKCIKNSKHPEWLSIIRNRTDGTGCPVCNESTGEREVARILDESGFEYKREQKFTGAGRLLDLGYVKTCKDRDFLRFDFCVFLKGSLLLIEYHGIQHYEPVEFFGGMPKLKSRRRRDHIKRIFARNNGIPLLEISYKDDTEKVLREWLKDMNMV